MSLSIDGPRGKQERLPDLTAELVHLKVDSSSPAGPTATGLAGAATVTIPLVMALDSDPVGNGFVASLARPGGNITGLSTLSPEISGKRLELLKEVIPGAIACGRLWDCDRAGHAEALKETELAATALKVQLQYLDVRSRKDIERGFEPQLRGVLTRCWCCASAV